MDKVWVVLGNWCDDTWIEAICTSEELAEKFKAEAKPVNKNHPDSTGYWIECWKMNTQVKTAIV